PMRLLAHARVEQERDDAVSVVNADYEAAEAAGHVGDLGQCGDPQLRLGRSIVDEIEEPIDALVGNSHRANRRAQLPMRIGSAAVNRLRKHLWRSFISLESASITHCPTQVGEAHWSVLPNHPNDASSSTPCGTMGRRYEFIGSASLWRPHVSGQ